MQNLKEQLAEALLNLSKTQEDRKNANFEVLNLREQLKKIESQAFTEKRSIEAKLVDALAAAAASSQGKPLQIKPLKLKDETEPV